MKSLFVSYNGLLDSLGQSQVLPYLRELRKDGHGIVILSFERHADQSLDRVRALREQLDKDGLHWHWLRYHKRPVVVSTLWDVLCGTVVACWLAVRHGVDALHARSQVAAAMAWPVVRLLRKRFIFDLRGQMAYEYADGGTWREGGLLCRLVEKAERRFVRDSDTLVVLTRVLAEDVAPHAPGSPVVIPTCVNLEQFLSPDPTPPPGPPVMAYCGSLGARYALSLLVQCYEEGLRQMSALRLLVVTHTDPARLLTSLREAQVDHSRVEVIRAEHEEVPAHLARAQFGVLLLQGRRSLRGACPTKVGEYLACGLPVLASAGIGDCLKQLEGNRVGVVLKGHDDEAFGEGLGRIRQLLSEGSALRERCRLIAEKEFSLAGVGGPAYRAMYRTMEASLKVPRASVRSI